MWPAGISCCRPAKPPRNTGARWSLFSAGEDTQSRFTREQALEAAHRADTIIYTISTNNTKAETNGDKVLRVLAQDTGGQAFIPQEAEDLGQSFENIANELRHQYRLSYRPLSKADGLFHPVEIRLKGHKDLVVRAAAVITRPSIHPQASNVVTFMWEFEWSPQAPRFEPSLDAWVLSRYSDVIAALRDKRLSAAGARAQGDREQSIEPRIRNFAKWREWSCRPRD